MTTRQPRRRVMRLFSIALTFLCVGRTAIAWGDNKTVWIFLGPTIVILQSFIASMTCWKITALMKGKSRAAGSLAPT
jgi:hypothetical protein